MAGRTTLLRNAAAATLALILLGATGVYYVSRARCFALTGPVVCRVETTRPQVALTFDDGPTPLGVETILPLLAQHRARATFFLTGAEIARRPDLARRLAAAGHELANHTYSHKRMIGRSTRFYDSELADTEALLRRVGGRSRLFRPPYGKKLVGLPLAVQRQGLTMVLWDVEDPKTSDPGAFARQVVAQARPGSIILLHAMYRANATGRAALPLILDGLEARGLQVVSVGELRAAARGPAAAR